MIPRPLSDQSDLPPCVIRGLLLLAGGIFIVRTVASLYFSDGDEADDESFTSCSECGKRASNNCSLCKSVWYCSEACWSKHHEAHHKLKCEQTYSRNDHGTREVLQEPKKILFPYDEFGKLFYWDKPGFPPCGLLNCGNSCFVNVVLQCLACTRPLAAYFLEGDHSRRCVRKLSDWCFLCDLQTHFKRASESLLPFSPTCIISRLSNIRVNLGYGNQEDAHEFMRCAIEKMQSMCLDEFGGEKALDPSVQETTLIQHIFGGNLQSQVTCTECHTISNRCENMMDLTVEIQGDAESLEDCLDQFTSTEWLHGENMYECNRCNGYVKARKQITVHQAPNILTIALKRFESGRFGKLNKRVTFPENLDLTPYTSRERDGTDLYTLYAVVVHLDVQNSSFYGHYICFTKDFNGQWYKIDDDQVMRVDVGQVLAQHAYMLFYIRKKVRQRPFIKPMEDTREKNMDVFLSSADINSQSSTEIANNVFIKDDSKLRHSDVPDVLVDCPKPSLSGTENLDDKEKLSSSRLIHPGKIAHYEVQDIDFQEPQCSLDEECCTEESNSSTSIIEKLVLEELCCSYKIDTEMAMISCPCSTTLVPVGQPPDDLQPKSELTELGSGSSNLADADEDTQKGSELCTGNGFKRKSELLHTNTSGFLDRSARKKCFVDKGKTVVENSGAAVVQSVNGCSYGHS
ncbi:hypothetical protein J5N97_002597 [Dioscorea zingiberensis]|uniref:Ubiquitinyl hydrolase 1 n=1 Tax=Dioscorea zingiberensis TaxID=325984 RepID=A0A9D5HPS2_9LILI|nr:hypothetical protein J5N97_002597 [Dioscorea zingiberensis]